MGTIVCGNDIDVLKEPSIGARPSRVAGESDCEHFEAEASACSKKERKKLIAALGRTYNAIVSVSATGDRITEFHSAHMPAITIDAYLARAGKYFGCSDSCLLIALIYIDRIIKLHPAFPVCAHSIHRILGISLTVAAKFADDDFYSNSYYAKVCGLTLKELNKLERDFLRMLAWNCRISPDEYQEYRQRVMAAC